MGRILEFEAPNGDILQFEEPETTTPSPTVSPMERILDPMGFNRFIQTAGAGFQRGLEAPGAAVRAGLVAGVHQQPIGQAISQALENPAQAPNFQHMAQSAEGQVPPTTSPLLNFTRSFGAGLAGTGANVVTDPYTWILGGLGKLGGKPALEAAKSVTGEQMGTALQNAGKALGENIPFRGTVTESLPRLFSTKRGAEFVRNAQKALFQSKYDAGTAYEQAAEAIEELSPYPHHNLYNVFDTFRNTYADDPDQWARIIRDIGTGAKRFGNPQILDLLEDPIKAEALTGKEIRQVKRTIDHIPSIAAKLPKGKFANWADTDIPLIDLKHSIAQAQVESLPGMEDVNKTYGTTMNNYRMVKPYFAPKQIIPNILKGFGGVENPQVVEAVRSLLPQKMLQEMQSLRMTNKAIKATKLLATGVGGEELLRALLRRQ